MTKAVENVFDRKDEHLMSILELVFENLHQSPFWEITPEFIESLGAHYFAVLTNHLLNRYA